MGQTNSYYEQLCQKITPLYPHGVQNGIMIQQARNAEFRNEYFKRMRKKSKPTRAKKASA